MEHGRNIEALKRQLAMATRKAEASLQDAEARYHTLVDAIDPGFCILEMIFDESGRATDYRFLETNQSFDRQSGLSNAVGRRIREFAPDLEEHWFEQYGQVAVTGEPMRVEGRVAPLDRWFDINAFRVGTPEQRRVAVLFTDISERRRIEAALSDSEARQAFLLRLSDALREELSPDTMADRSLRMLMEQLQLDRCYVGVYRLAEDIGEFPYQVHGDEFAPLPAQVRLSDFPKALQIAFDRTLVIHDVVKMDGLSDADRASFKGLGLGALIAATLRKGENNPLWAIVAVSVESRAWTPGEVALVEEVTERTWAAIERIKAEAALRESEARLAAAFEGVPVGLAVINPAGISTVANAEYRRFLPTGIIPSRDPERGSRWRAWDADGERLTPDNFPGARAMRGLRTVPGMEMLYTDDDGRDIWTMVATVPIRDAADRVTGQIAVISDIDERKRATEALRESEQRFAQFAASSTDVLWIRAADTMDMEYLSPVFTSVYGTEPEAAMGGVHHWAALIVPEDRATALDHLETARRGEATVREYRIRRPSDGDFRWIRDHAFPLSDGHGVKWIGGIGTDVTESKLSAEHQSILLAELQHRVRNIMSMLRSVATRTATTASDVADYESLITGRLMALARTQALLTRAANVGVELSALIRQELKAVADHDGQYVLSGPEVVISPKAAEVLSLAIHELATNALKYGALSTPDGIVEVNIEVVGPKAADRLRLQWSERRPAPPDWSPPKRKGFGTQLIEQRVPYELRGHGEIVISADGVTAVIEFPLQSGASILETDAPGPGAVFGGSIDMTGEPSLTGQRVLVLEDDFYLAQDASAALSEAGAEVVGPFGTSADAIDAIKNRSVSAAMLDINLGSGPSFEMAHAMREAGAPFVFVTGYDQQAIPAEFAHITRLEKPVEPRDIIRAVAALG